MNSRLNVILTKFGDIGKTDLVTRIVSKSSKIIDFIGCLDEANCAIGNALNQVPEMLNEYGEMFNVIQNNLFDLAADVIHRRTKVGEKSIAYIEDAIVQINKNLPELTSFVIPGGKVASIHLARAVVRRAERVFWSLKKSSGYKLAGTYLNRLSDLLFIVSRDINHKYYKQEEETWKRL